MIDKSKLLSDEDIKGIIADGLFENGLIDDEIYEKCGKPHISSLPHDLRTNDPEKLQLRKDAVINKWKEVNNEINDKHYPEEFWDMAQGDGDQWDDSRGRFVSVDSQRVVDHYDNLLKSSNGLNDLIRERYDEQINKLTEENENLQNVLKDFDEKTIEQAKKIEGINMSINGNEHTLSDINEKLRDTENLADRRNKLQAQLDDGYAIIERFLKENNLPDNFTDGIDQSPDYRRQVNEEYDGFGDYVNSIMNLEAEIESYKEPEYYENLISKLRDRRDRLESDTRNLERTLIDERNLLDAYQRSYDGGRRAYDNNYLRIRNLKENKPNKSQKSNESYNKLVEMKNLAIEFNNDCNKARDYQDELARINIKLGVYEDHDLEGLPENKYGYIHVY